jgi:hypothetical protein
MADIKTVTQAIEVANVADIQVSDPVDMGNGTWKRALRIYETVNGDPVLTVYVVGDAKADIEIQTPLLKF